MKRILYISLLAVLLFSACTSEEVPGEKSGSENIEMLIDGAPHGAVYGYLEKKNQELVRSSIVDL